MPRATKCEYCSAPVVTDDTPAICGTCRRERECHTCGGTLYEVTMRGKSHRICTNRECLAVRLNALEDQ